jgi:endonuclease-3
MSRIALPQVVERLQSHYGKQKPPTLDGPWEMILWENVAYMADDDRRLQAFQTLKKQIGIEPASILSASKNALLEVTRHGIVPEQFVEKLRKCAKLVVDEFVGDLRQVLEWPFAKAKKGLQKFPGIGEPGAEKILVFCKAYPVLAVDSNGLRVLERLSFGEEKKSYAATYRLVTTAASNGLDQDCPWYIQTHLLLRRHGQEICKRSEPKCAICPLAEDCEFNRGKSK